MNVSVLLAVAAFAVVVPVLVYVAVITDCIAYGQYIGESPNNPCREGGDPAECEELKEWVKHFNENRQQMIDDQRRDAGSPC